MRLNLPRQSLKVCDMDRDGRPRRSVRRAQRSAFVTALSGFVTRMISALVPTCQAVRMTTASRRFAKVAGCLGACFLFTAATSGIGFAPPDWFQLPAEQAAEQASHSIPRARVTPRADSV